MKTCVIKPSRQLPSGMTSERAFTLAEMMTTLAIFALVVAAMVSLQLFGFRVNALTTSKLKSTASSLKILDQIRNNVLEAYSVSVGNGNRTSFTATGTNGNALQIYPGTNVSNYLRFYLVTTNASLFELSSTNNQVSLIASNIVNQTAFETVDFQGNISSSSQEHYSIRMTLQFVQLDYRLPGNTYEYYTLKTEMTPRTQ
jgi:prepilin-type N-terminal cleavage/methylation domain-containing protein